MISRSGEDTHRRMRRRLKGKYLLLAVFSFGAFYAPAAFAVSAVVDSATSGWMIFANFLISITAVLFAIFITGWMMKSRLTHRQTVNRLRARLSKAEGRLYWAQSILAVEPQVVLVWDGSEEAPVPLDFEDEDEIEEPIGEDDEEEAPKLLSGPTKTSPLGNPQILGSPKALGSILGAGGAVLPGTKGGRDGDLSVFDVFLSGLTRKDKSLLVASIQDLKMDGQPFLIHAASEGGKTFQAEGRPAGGKAVVWLRDVTHEGQEVRELATEITAISEERDALAAVLDATPFPMWQRDRALNIKWVNKAFVRAVEEEDLGNVITKSVELDHGGKEMARKAAEEIDLVSEHRYVVIDGQRRSLNFMEMPLPEGTMGVALDATRLDEAENVLQRHIDAHSETLNTLATSVAIYGSDKRLIFFNQAFVELMGLPSDWLATQPLESEVLERLREARRLPEQADFPAWKRSRLDLYVNLLEQQDEMWHLPDGRTFRVIVQPHPFGGLIYLYEDVTDLVTLESNYNQLIHVQRETLDNLSEGVAVYGSDGRLKLHNAAFQSMWKLDGAKLATEPHFDNVTGWCGRLVDDPGKWHQLRKRVTSGEDGRKPFGAQMDRTDGVIVSYGAVPLPDGGTLISFLDVSDTTKVERALRERNEALETADRLKSEFVNHVSYQLRTPLNSIIGFADLMDQQIFGELNEKQQEYTGNILQASNQLLSLINDILDLATIEAGGMALEMEEIGVSDVLSSVVQINQKKALDNALTINVECGEDVGSIFADERRLKQILFNLMTNAMGFTQNGGSVTLGAKRIGREVAMWVQDTGSGIEPKYQATVFDRFENRGGDGERGAGLGLSLVKSFVELHGGWVSLESQVGVGTKVTCHLVDRAQAEAAE